MSYSDQYYPVSRAYDNVIPQKKPLFKKALSSMSELDADYSNSLGKLMEVIGSNQVENMKMSNPQLRTNLDSWENELSNANQTHRDKIGLLIQDLKYIAPALHSDPAMSSKLNEASSILQPQASQDISTRFTPQQLDKIMADKMSILYPSYRRQSPALTPAPTPVISSSQIQLSPRAITPPIVTRSPFDASPQPSQAYRIDERGNKVYMNIPNGQDRSPRASDIRRTTQQLPPNNTNTKYFVVDPFTGELVERIGDLSPRITYPAPQTTIYPAPQTTIYTTPQPTTIYTTPQPNSSTYVQPAQASSQPQPTQYREIQATNNDSIPQALNPTDYRQQQPIDPETAKMISDAREDFSTPLLEIVPVSGNPTKVDVAKNGQQAIYGGDNIGIMRKQDGWVVDDGIVFDNKTSTIKHLNNGEVLVNNFDNWDLVLLDQNLNEKGKLNGGSRGEPHNYKNINTRTSEDDANILWLSHPDNLSIVKTNNLSSNEIKNFWRFNGNRSNPVACAISPTGKKLVGISNCNGTFVLHFYDGTDQVVMYRQEDIHPRCTFWECLEIGYDQDMFLLGGRDSQNNAMVLAMTLDDDCNLLTEKVLPNLRSVSTLRRHNQGDIFFAGGYKAILILFYRKKIIHVLNDIAIPIEGYIRDLSFNPPSNDLYGVTGTDKAFVLDFTDQSRRPKKSQYKPDVETRNRRKLGPTLSRNPSQSNIQANNTQPNGRAITSSHGPSTNEPRISPKHTSAFNDYSIKQLTLPDCNFDLPRQIA